MLLARRGAMKHNNPRLDSINKRALEFVCQIIDPFVLSMADRPGLRRIQDQLVGASGGIGSNLEDLCEPLLLEGLQIARIIASIIINTKNNDGDNW